MITVGLVVLAIAAGLDRAWLVSGVLGAVAFVLAVGAVLDAGIGISTLVSVCQGEA
jgi:hypothetical protein